MGESRSSIGLIILVLLSLGFGAGCRRAALGEDVELRRSLARAVSDHTLQHSVEAVLRSARYQVEVLRPDNGYKGQYREPIIVRLIPRGEKDPVFEWEAHWCGTFALDNHDLYIADFACNMDFGFQDAKIRRIRLPAGDVVWTRPLPWLQDNDYLSSGSSRGTGARVLIRADSYCMADGRNFVLLTARDTAGTDVYEWTLDAEDGSVTKSRVFASRLYAGEQR